LQFLVKELAKDLDLNVLFDSESFRTPQKVFIELKNVTAAKALDYIFLQQNLFFQKVGPRTILVAVQNRAKIFSNWFLRTFYLANADPTEVQKTSFRQFRHSRQNATITLVDKATNSITVRDTQEKRAAYRQIDKFFGQRPRRSRDGCANLRGFQNDLLQIGNQSAHEAV
jgi:hypothetical protein